MGGLREGGFFSGLRRTERVFGLLLFASFAHVALLGGQYGTGAFFALAAAASLWILRKDLGRWLGRFRDPIMGGLWLDLLAIVGLAAWFLVRPVDAGWSRVEGTSGWGDPVLAACGEHGIVALANPDSARPTLFGTGDGGRTWHEIGGPPTFGWSLCFDSRDGALWVGPREGGMLHRYSFSERRWADSSRPMGYVWGIACQAGRLFLAVERRLYRRGPASAWTEVRAARNCSDVVAFPGAEPGLVLAVGSTWVESCDGGETWRDVTPPGVALRRPAAALGGGGWRYVFEGGILKGGLYAAPPGGAFEERPLPTADVRVAAANPADGREIYIATWGAGVFHSRDGGLTWEYAGLRGIECRSLAVDWSRGTLYAGSSALLFGRGVYVRSRHE